MYMGDLVSVSGHTGTVLEVVETDTEQKVTLELKDGRVATFIFIRKPSQALDGLKLA